MAIVTAVPFIIIFVYLAFSFKMFTFWALFVINYFLQMKDISLPVPMSLPNEILQILLLAISIIDARQTPHFDRAANLMLMALIIWCGFCTLEILNDTCNLGIDIGAWYTGARLMAFQILYTFFVFSVYISSPEILNRYIKLWAILSLFTVYWTWKQQHLGFTPAENSWMQTRGRTTHILNAGTLIRYFSTFSDAASYGCNAAATTVAFILFGITSKIKFDRIFYIATGILVFWGMFASGTRTAIFCMAGGFMAFVGGRGYMIEEIGLRMGYNVPANNKYAKLATIPPDSEYVYIWIRTGPIGMTVFVITTLLMFLGACSVVLFKLKNKSLIGIGAGFCCAFVSIQLGGYANQVLMQFPNCLIFYGGLSIVYVLPYIEPEWIKYEEERYAKQEEKKRLKLEKKLAERV